MSSPIARPNHRFALTPTTATLVVTLACVSFGMVPLFARLLLEAGMSAAAIGFFRYAFSGIVMLPFLPLARNKRRDALRLIAALVVFDGTASGAGSWALLLSLPAPILFALIIVVLTCLTPTLSSVEKLSCGMVGSVVGLAPIVALTDPAAFLPRDGEVWLTILAMGLVTALIPQLLYTIAAPRIGPGRAAAAGAVELPTMIVLGWLAFGETVGVREIAASGLVLAAILLVPPISAPRPATA